MYICLYVCVSSKAFTHSQLCTEDVAEVLIVIVQSTEQSTGLK